MRLLEALEKAAKELELSLREARERAQRLLRSFEAEGAVRPVKASGPVRRAGGVDGYFVKVAESPSKAVYAVRAAGVVVEGVDVLRTELFDDVVVLDRPGDEDAAEAAQFVMMSLEARCLSNLARSGGHDVVLIDGPIVDPPFHPRSPVAKMLASGYHERRARLVLEASRRTLVIGYVKRPRVEVLKHVGRFEPEAALLVLHEALALHEWEAALLGPFEPEGSIHGLYAELGLEVEVCYLATLWWSGIRKLESPKGACPRAAELVLTLTPKGLQHPIPVQLAHELAGRLGREAKALRSRLAARLSDFSQLIRFIDY